MFTQSPKLFPAGMLTILGLALLTQIGCQHDPEKTVTVEISGITDEQDRDDVLETLKGMAEGSGHMITSTYSGDQMTVRLSPVGDVEAFSRKVNFGTVIEVQDRTVKVDFVK